MSEELIDVLDKNGNKINKVASRDEIFSLGLWHATIHIWIINSNREVLLQKRSLSKRTYAGLITMSVTGTVNAGETPQDTAMRELKEELDITATNDELVKLSTQKVSAIIPESLNHDNEFISVYILYRDISLSCINIQVEEVDSVNWYPWESFKKDISDPVNSHQYINIPDNYYPDVIKKIDSNIQNNLTQIEIRG